MSDNGQKTDDHKPASRRRAVIAVCIAAAVTIAIFLAIYVPLFLRSSANDHVDDRPHYVKLQEQFGLDEISWSSSGAMAAEIVGEARAAENARAVYCVGVKGGSELFIVAPETGEPFLCDWPFDFTFADIMGRVRAAGLKTGSVLETNKDMGPAVFLRACGEYVDMLGEAAINRSDKKAALRFDKMVSDGNAERYDGTCIITQEGGRLHLYSYPKGEQSPESAVRTEL